MPHLRTLRYSRGLTILEIAQRSGLTARIITELEYGLRPLDTAARLSLARSYDLAAEDLETPLAVPASLSWRYLAHIVSQQLILAALIATLTVILLFGGAIYAAESHTPVPAERPLAHGDGLEPRLRKRYLFASTSNSRRRPNTTMSHHVMERALYAVSPTMTPTATPRPLPSATPQPAPTATAQPAPPEPPSPPPPEPPSPVPTDAPGPAPTDAPSPVPTEPPSPPPTEAPNPSAGAAPQSNRVFMPLPADGSFHDNVVVALEANNGALQHVVIPPNDVWSFNRTIGDPDLLQLEPVYGVYGGGWCDLASRYTMVLRPLLPPESFEFIRHSEATGFGLQGIPDQDAVAIWNSNGADGEQDLRIHNTSGRTISIHVTLVADGVQFQATLE